MKLKLLHRAVMGSLVAIAVSLVAAAPTANDPQAWKGLTPDQVKKVKAGQIVILDQDTSQGDQQKRFIQAAVIFSQPVDVVYKLFRQTETQARYLPDLESCKLISRNAKGDIVEFHVKILMMDIVYRIHHVYDDANCYLSWGLDPSFDNDIKQGDGYWRLFKYDDKHTLARYGTNVQVSSYIPAAVMDRLTKGNLPENLQAVKTYIDSGGTYRKPGYKGK